MGLEEESLLCILVGKYLGLTFISRLDEVSTQNLFYFVFPLFKPVNFKLIIHIILLVIVCNEDKLDL